MNPISIVEFNQMLTDDCKMSIETFYADHSWDVYPRPYSVVSDYSDPTEGYRILFPQLTDKIDRPSQYYFLSRVLNNLLLSRIGVVAYLELQIPARPEIDEKFWNRTARAALIGSSFRIEELRDNIRFEKYMLIFDMIDGELVFCNVENQSIWQDIVNNLSLFRDFLTFSALSSPRSPYRWTEALAFIQDFGFELDFTSDVQRNRFLASQEALIGLSV